MPCFATSALDCPPRMTYDRAVVWSAGPLVRRSAGPPVRRSAGPLVRWSAGRWSAGSPVRWSAGPLVRRSAGPPSAGPLVRRSAGPLVRGPLLPSSHGCARPVVRSAVPVVYKLDMERFFCSSDSNVRQRLTINLVGPACKHDAAERKRLTYTWGLKPKISNRSHPH